ncbi:MAG: tRNA 2-thiouridine(34) synthase MnmA [Aquificaceae bacterium]|nr:tRNA 2-thiouridine(34) synthase MnmA [Aquificaceae bacterium]MDW8433959.1 tRNA 2-thiouridine(34) synthase MnmA [Aquificaceae bacterium]
MRIAVGMSGGVDSSVCCLLMKETGHEVIGITLRFHQDACETDGLRVCCSPQDVRDAVSVSERLGIPHLTLSWEQIFEERVVQYFIVESLKGRTPNPCAVCNREVKTGFLAEYLRKVANIDALATGHYAKFVKYKGSRLIARARDRKRDQSYFLSLVKREHLDMLLFPLGDLTKEEVRRMAQERGLMVWDKRDSQDVCFLMGKEPGEFIQERVGSTEGYFYFEGKQVGKHKGFFHYTIGQRKGLGVSLGFPVYVCGVNHERNEVYLCREEELYKNWLLIENLNTHLDLDLWGHPKAQVRYSSQEVEVSHIEKKENGYLVTFRQPVRGITPGQVCAFYEGDVLLGGGVIVE